MKNVDIFITWVWFQIGNVLSLLSPAISYKAALANFLFSGVFMLLLLLINGCNEDNV